MLRRLKSATPKLRILIGLWLLLEIASIPAAAGLAVFFTAQDDPIMAEKIDTLVAGRVQYLVTHSVPFDVTVGGVTDRVDVKVEGTRAPLLVETRCAQFVSDAPRIVKTVQAPLDPNVPIESLFVTVLYDGDVPPVVSFDMQSEEPPALPCQTIS